MTTPPKLLPITLSLALLSLVASASPTQAQGGNRLPATRPNRDVGDVITQPISDVNLKKKEIPPELSAILDDPYDLTGIRKCRQIIAAVRTLDSVLGPDFDEAEEATRGDKRKQTVLTMAGGAISSLIPFRFLVRELTGANKSDEAYRAAIYAGVVRRGFLKGYGKARHCRAPGSPWPNRPAPPAEAVEEDSKSR